MIYEVIINITSYWFITRLKFFRPNEVDSNEMAISTDTYELTGRDVSSLLADQAQDDGSRWISQCCIFRFDTRFGLAIGTEYFGIGPFRRSVSGLPQIFIYI
jgi:hypothetical protein